MNADGKPELFWEAFARATRDIEAPADELRALFERLHPALPANVNIHDLIEAYEIATTAFREHGWRWPAYDRYVGIHFFPGVKVRINTMTDAEVIAAGMRINEVRAMATAHGVSFKGVRTKLGIAQLILRFTGNSQEICDVIESVRAKMLAEFMRDQQTDMGKVLVRQIYSETHKLGRLAEYRDPVHLSVLAGVEYSAILDQRTTEVCQFLHGKIFKPNDPALERLTPPLHVGCRSNIVPLVIGSKNAAGEFISSGDFITPEQVEEAIELAENND